MATSMVASTLASFVVIKSYDYSNKGNAYRKDNGSVVIGEESVFSALVKIAVEPAKSSKKYVNLRFCYSNRYWQRNANDKFIVSESTQPEEDTSKPSCTLFEATEVKDEGVFYLTHVQSGGRVRIDGQTLAFYVDQNPKEDGGYLTYVNWNTLVKLPDNVHVAFKGDNGYYLKAYWKNKLPYLQFSSSDPNDSSSEHKIQLMPDGHVTLLCEYWSKFWRRESGWIRAGATTAGPNDVNTLFWPIKMDDNTIALRSAGNNNICRRISIDNKPNCLIAETPNLSEFARMQVQELVLERKIFNVRYRMKDARIFDEKPLVAGTGTVVNEGDVETVMVVHISFKDERSYSFSNSISIGTGIKTSIQAGVLGIQKSSIEVSYNINATLEWGSTITTGTTITVSDTISVPPRSKVSVNYVGTQGTCNVPFDYTQQDRSSVNGKITETRHIDGVYTDVNSYNFIFHVQMAQPL